MTAARDREKAHGRLHRALMATVAAEPAPPADWTGVELGWDDWKERVTLRLDRSVVDYFRALGPGYQPRINRVLAAFVHGKLAGPAEAAPAAAPARAETEKQREAREDKEWWRKFNADYNAHMRKFWAREDSRKAEAAAEEALRQERLRAAHKGLTLEEYRWRHYGEDAAGGAP